MSETTTMQAVIARQEGGPEVLEIGRVPVPEMGDDELLVRVRATALNRADLMQRQGKYPPPEGASPILGLELAGEVIDVGPSCQGWEVGDRVFGLLPGGGYAEYAVIHHGTAMPIPPGMSFEQAAAIPEVFLTAFQALHWYGDVEKGLSVLIHAGASGVGTAAIQLAKAAGARVVVTASAGKHDICLDLGADLAVDYHTEDFAERVMEATGGRGADIVVDFVGAPYFTRNVDSLAVDGRLILLATLGGSRVEGLDLRALFAKRANIFASTLRSRDLTYKIRLTSDFRARVLPLFAKVESGRMQPVVDRVLSWKDAAEAHRVMGDNENAGKIVLRVD